MEKQKLTQCDKILLYMKDYGSITPLDALREFSCMRLASRISDLKKRGLPIVKTMQKGINRYGETVRFAAYSLGENDGKNIYL